MKTIGQRKQLHAGLQGVMLYPRARVVSMNTMNLHPSRNKSIQFLAIQMTLLLKVILLCVQEMA